MGDDVQPNGWVFRRIDEVADTATGGTPRRNNAAFFTGTIPWVKSGELEGGVVTDANEKLTQEGVDSCNARVFPRGTVMIAMYGATIGRLGILGIDAATNQAVCSFFPRAGLDSQYLYHFLQTIRAKLLNDSFGGAQPNISQTLIRKLLLPVPPLDQQRRIVTKIEELTAKLHEAQRLHREASLAVGLLFEAGLASAFDPVATVEWPTHSTETVLTPVAGQVDPREEPYADMPHVGPDAIETGTARLLPDSIRTPRELGLTSGKYLFGPAHVLYSKIRPALRKVALPDFAGVCSADMYPLLPNADLISREFLALSLLSPAFSRYAVDKSERNAMPKINRTDLFAYEMPVPDKDTQKQIVRELFGLKERAERLAVVQTEIDAELESFTPALLSKAFRGEL